MPHLGLAFATRGLLDSLGTIADELEQFYSFDNVISGAAANIQQEYENGSFDFCNGSEFDLVVVGWSESRRCAEAYTLSSVKHGELNHFAFNKLDLIIAPQLSAADLEESGLTKDGDFVSFNPNADLLRIMEIQRTMKLPIGTTGESVPSFVVGGHAVLTTITERAITQRVVRRWPDHVGETIEPYKNYIVTASTSVSCETAAHPYLPAIAQ